MNRIKAGITSGRVFKRIANFPFGRKFVGWALPNGPNKPRTTVVQERSPRSQFNSCDKSAGTAEYSKLTVNEQDAKTPRLRIVSSNSQTQENTDERANAEPQNPEVQEDPIANGEDDFAPETRSRVDPGHLEECLQNSTLQTIILQSSSSSARNFETPVTVTNSGDGVLSKDSETLLPVEEGEITTTTVTNKMLWQLNMIFHCERKIRNRQKILQEYHEMEFQASNVVLRFESRLLEKYASLKDEETDLADLEGMKDCAKQVADEIERLGEKLQQNQQVLQQVWQEWMGDWKQLLKENSLIKPPSDTSEGSMESNDPDSIQELSRPQRHEQHYFAPYKPTPSEASREQAAEEKAEARQQIIEIEIKRNMAKDKVECWYEYYERKLALFMSMDERKQTETNRTEFDLALLMEERQAIADWIQAEKEWHQAREDAKAIGVFFNDADQESNFQAHPHDGCYSMTDGENRVQVLLDALVGSVNHAWINAWREECLDSVDVWVDANRDEPEPLDEDQEEPWEAKEAKPEDSVSVRDLGFGRRKIDLWNEMTARIRMEREQEGDGILSRDGDVE